MKKGIKEFWKVAEEIFPESPDLIAKTKRGIEGAVTAVAPMTLKNCQTWRGAWLYSFRRADLDPSDFMKLDDCKVTCVVWIGREFNDKLASIVEKIAKRLGPDRDLTELRLIGTDVSEKALGKLKTFLPKAIITRYSEEEREVNPRLAYADGAKGKEMFPE